MPRCVACHNLTTRFRAKRGRRVRFLTVGFTYDIRYYLQTKQLVCISGVTYLQHRMTDKVERSALLCGVSSSSGRAGSYLSTCSTQVPRLVRGFFFGRGVTTHLTQNPQDQ